MNDHRRIILIRRADFLHKVHRTQKSRHGLSNNCDPHRRSDETFQCEFIQKRCRVTKRHIVHSRPLPEFARPKMTIRQRMQAMQFFLIRHRTQKFRNRRTASFIRLHKHYPASFRVCTVRDDDEAPADQEEHRNPAPPRVVFLRVDNNRGVKRWPSSVTYS